MPKEYKAHREDSLRTTEFITNITKKDHPSNGRRKQQPQQQMQKKIRKKKQLMHIHLVITLRPHIFTYKRLNVKKMNRYFVPETVMVYRTAEKKWISLISVFLFTQNCIHDSSYSCSLIHEHTYSCGSFDSRVRNHFILHSQRRLAAWECTYSRVRYCQKLVNAVASRYLVLATSTFFSTTVFSIISCSYLPFLSHKAPSLNQNVSFLGITCSANCANQI